MTARSIRLLYCYLREKWTTLEISEEVNSGRDTFPRRKYQCLSVDETCGQRRCSLAGESTDATRAPWFDE